MILANAHLSLVFQNRHDAWVWLTTDENLAMPQNPTAQIMTSNTNENNHIKYTEIADFQTDLLYNIELEELNALSNKMFKKEYGNRNFSWRGKSILIRNLELKKNEQDD